MRSPYDQLMMVFSRINLACAALAAAILFGVASIIFFEVVSRSLLGTSRLWVIEVSEYALLFITFLAAPYLLEKNKHVMIDLIYDNLVGPYKQAVTFLISFIGVAMCGLLTYVGIEVVQDQMMTGVRETTVMAPQSFWITAAFPFGMALMTIQFFDKLICSIFPRKEAL
jgi:TRAP-type C4-dicarboxylate transport system permease small subunit